MRRRTDGEWDSRHIRIREYRVPMWRRLLSVAIAAAFTVVMISLGLMRHRHLRDDTAGGLVTSPPAHDETFR